MYRVGWPGTSEDVDVVTGVVGVTWSGTSTELPLPSTSTVTVQVPGCASAVPSPTRPVPELERQRRAYVGLIGQVEVSETLRASTGSPLS